MQKITGEGVALISKYTAFDPAHPEKTPAAEYTIVSKSCLTKDGALRANWASDGYIMVGTTNIEITMFPREVVTSRAIATLKAQKEAVLAKASAEATRIEGQIQSLLAITNQA